ncbi:MAG: integrase core domain-containing protein [Acidobacteriaceae bacterium]
MLSESWRVHYNTVRPHSSVGYRPPGMRRSSLLELGKTCSRRRRLSSVTRP